MSTIAAISSPIGAGGIGIVRVSGEEALRIADAIFYFAHPVKDDGTVCRVQGVKQNWKPLMMNFGTFQGLCGLFPRKARVYGRRYC